MYSSRVLGCNDYVFLLCSGGAVTVTILYSNFV